jgi:hypothetical protein
MNVFDEIREKTAWVTEGARWVARDEMALGRLADAFLEEAPVPTQDPGQMPFPSAEATLAYLILLDAVNFGSGWFLHLQKPVEASGYKTVARALRAYCEAKGVPEAEELARFQPGDCAEIFAQAGNTAVQRLMELFAESWNHLGMFLLEAYEGSFQGLVEDANSSVERLVAQLVRMPLYRDVALYRGIEVPFYKRAQITCADLHLAFDGEGFGRFDDIDVLTLFADNLVPHVLRWEGVLVYRPELLRRIQSQETLESGGEPEVEIRAAAVCAVEALSRLLGERGRPTPPRSLDHWLWHRGQSPVVKSSPRHRTRCAYY